MSLGLEVPGWLPLPPLVASVPCFCLNSLSAYSMCDPMWSIITIRFFCYVSFLGHCIFCLSLAVDCYWVISPWPVLISTPAKATARSPPTRPRPETHTFIHSVFQQIAARAIFFAAGVWGTRLGWLWFLLLERVDTCWCQLRSWALSVNHVVDVDRSRVIKICI